MTLKKEPLDKYCVIKTSLKNITLSRVDYNPLFSAVQRGDDVTVHTSQFLNLFQIKQAHLKKELLEINEDIILMAISALKTESAGPKTKGENKLLLDKFIDFYNMEYKWTTNNMKLDCTNLSHINGYIVTQIVTNFYNNIKFNFINNVRGFVNKMFKKEHDDKLSKLEGKEESELRKKLKSDLTTIKTNLLTNTKNADLEYDKWLDLYRNNILPPLEGIESYEKDVNENPFKYYKYMIDMNIILEKNNLKQNCVFPTRSCNYSKYIQLDSASLVDLFIKKDQNSYTDNIQSKKDELWESIFDMKNNAFKMKGYTFDYCILTDGYGVSIRLINNNYVDESNNKKSNLKNAKNIIQTKKNELREILKKEFLEIKNQITNQILEERLAELKNHEKKLSPEDKKEIRAKYSAKMKEEIQKIDTNLENAIDASLEKYKQERDVYKKNQNKINRQKKKEIQKANKQKYKDMPKEEKEECKKKIHKEKAEFLYLEELDEEELEEIRNKKRIYIDPGKRSLLMMVSDIIKNSNDENGKQIKNSEEILNYTNKTRLKRTKRLKYQRLNENFRSKTGLKRLESELAGYNSKTSNYDELKKYYKKKNQIREIIKKEFDLIYMKKLKWYSYINNKKADKELLKMIEDKFGKDIVIMMGDWSIGKQMRNFISTPNLRIKRVLARKFGVYNVDEYKTSCINYKTKGRMENLYLKDKTGKMRKIHSVLTYETENKSKGCINRDKNGMRSIRKIVNEYLDCGTRPEEYKRQKKVTELTVKYDSSSAECDNREKEDTKELKPRKKTDKKKSKEKSTKEGTKTKDDNNKKKKIKSQNLKNKKDGIKKDKKNKPCDVSQNTKEPL